MRKTALISPAALIPYSVAIVASIAVPLAAGRAAAESKTDTIGPWEIEAAFKGDKFDRCSITRKLDDDIVATFVRTGDDLTLELSSPNWKLERGKLYPVKMALGPVSFDEQVAAKFGVGYDGRQGQEIHRRAPQRERAQCRRRRRHHPHSSRQEHGSIRPARSMRRKNERAVETNPFVAPARQP